MHTHKQRKWAPQGNKAPPLGMSFLISTVKPLFEGIFAQVHSVRSNMMHASARNVPHDVPHQQREALKCSLAKVHPVCSTHDVGVFVDETNDFFQTP